MAWLKEELVNILIKEEIISRVDIPRIVGYAKEKGIDFFDAIVALKLVDKDLLTMVLAKGLGVPFLRLSKLEIEEGIVKVVPLEVMQRYKVVPISEVRDVLTVAVVDPWNYMAVDDLKLRTGKQIALCLTPESEFKKFIEKFKGEEGEGDHSAEELQTLLSDFSEEDLELVEEKEQGEGDRAEVEANMGPAVRAVNKIVETGVALKASDIFIEPFEKHMRVRYRVDGILREVESPPRSLHEAIISRIKVLGRMDISEHRLPQDGKFRMKIGGRVIDFRVSIVPSSFGEKACLRILDKGAVMLDLDNLGFHDDTLEKIKRCVRRPHGMFVVTGPTGSGKSTTLYSVLRYIDSPEKNIITVEDPVEYQLRGINQVQVNSEVGLTFASALRSILRQDPDIILIGEIRDHETMDIAIKAALTGHLVLTTLHTNTAPGAIVRMVNMGVEPFLITASVVGIMAQRLVRRLCEDCKEPYVMTKEMAQHLKIDKKYIGKTFYKPVGCKKCLGIGYKGRTNIAEIMLMSSRIKNLIARGAEEPEIAKAAMEEGMRTMREDALMKAAEGITSIEEVFRVTAK